MPATGAERSSFSDFAHVLIGKPVGHALGRERSLARARHVLLEHGVLGVDLAQQDIIAPEVGEVLEYPLGVRLLEQGAVHHGVAQQEPAVAGEIDVDHLDVGIGPADVVLAGELAADAAIAALVVDRLDLDSGLVGGVVVQVEHAHLSHQARTEKLADEALVAIVGPDLAQHRHDVPAAGDIGEPFAVLVVGLGDDPRDVAHHGEAQRIGIEAGEALIVVAGLEHDVGVRLQELEEIAVADAALLVQARHDSIVHVGRGTLVHDLGLALRIEVLRDVAHDAQQLALPGLQARRGLLEKVQDVLLRQSEQRTPALHAQLGGALARSGRDGAPQVVEHALLMTAALALALLLLAQIELLLAGVAVDAVRHQRVRRIERALDRDLAVALLALADVALGEIEVVENALGVGPQLEKVVVLEEMVVTERGMEDTETLVRRGILLHEVGDARRAVDHDLVGEPPETSSIERLVMGEMLAEGPVLVEQRHADRGIGIEHLLGGDDLDLVGIDVEPKLAERNLLAGVVHPLQDGEIPVGTAVEPFARGHDAARSFPRRRWNSSWNTGKISLRSLTLRMERCAPPARRRSYSVHNAESGIAPDWPASPTSR